MQYVGGFMAFDTENKKYKRKINGKWVSCKFKDLIQIAVNELPMVWNGYSLKRLMKQLEKN